MYIFFIGLVLTFIPPEAIKSVLGSKNTVFATIMAAIAGSVTLIPAFVAFPLEKKEFGFKFALTRNLLSFVAALSIAAVMGALL